MRWTVAVLETSCGRCGARIGKDEPIALFGEFKRHRCTGCSVALGFPVNWEELDEERLRLEQDAIRAAQPVTRSLPVAPAGRRFVPIAHVAQGFDFQMAAANDGRDEDE